MPGIARTLCATAVGLALLPVPSPASAQDPASDQEEAPGLIELLALMPATGDPANALHLFSYVDFRAIEAAAGIDAPDVEVAYQDGFDAFADWSQDDVAAWFQARRRIVTGPPDIVSHAGMVGRTDLAMADATGVDYFAIDRAMDFHQASGGYLMAGDAPMAVIDDMTMWSDLRSRGHALADVDGVPVWHRFEDNGVALLLADEGAAADPFDGEAMRAVRLAVLPDLLILARNWADLETTLAIRAGEAEPSPVVPLLQRMVAATLMLDGVDQRVLQAWASPVSALMPQGGAVPDVLAQMFADGGGQLPDAETLAETVQPTDAPAESLPAYPVALFADLQAGDMQVNAIALPFASRAAADVAAQVLAARLSAWVLPRGPADERAIDVVDGTVEALVVDAPGIGADLAGALRALGAAGGGQMADADGAIAVVAVRYPMSAATQASSSSTAGIVLYWLAASLLNRDLTLLSVP